MNNRPTSALLVFQRVTKALLLGTSLYALPDANAQIDWSASPQLTDSDKTAIAEIASKAHIPNPIVEERRVYVGLWYLIRSPIRTDGVKRSWLEMTICQGLTPSCFGDSNWNVGDWRVIEERSEEEWWHFTDGELEVDVELGGAVSYAEAESIVRAIHRDQLEPRPESSQKPRYDASEIKTIRADDPLERLFFVHITGGFTIHDLRVRLDGDTVTVIDGITSVP